jgi:DNA-binding GntR family transcriptional regulator
MIEPQIAAQLARSRNVADIAALEAVVDEADAAAERNDPTAFGIIAVTMHETLMERSGNNTMATISKLLHEMVQAYYSRAMDAVEQAQMRRAVRSYRKLIDLIRAGDAAGAAAHWEAQMSYTIRGNDAGTPLTVQ